MRRVRTLLAPRGREWAWLALALGLAVLTLAAGIGLLALSGWFITAAAFAGAGAMTLNIFAPAAGIRALAVTRTLARYLERLVAHETTFRQLARLRTRVFSRLLSLTPDRLHRLGRGNALDRLTADVDQLDRVFIQLVSPTLAALFATLLAALLVTLFAPGTGTPLWLLAVAGPVLLATGARLVRAPGRHLAEATPRLRVHLTETLAGALDLRLLGRLDDARQQVDRAARAQLATEVRLRTLEAAGTAVLQAIGAVSVWSVLVLSLAVAGTLTPPAVVLALLASLAAAEAWPPLAGGWSRLAACRRSGQRLQAILQPSDAPPARPPPSGVNPPPNAPLVLAGITFRHGPIGEALLRDLDLTLAFGTRTAVVGPSGSGKTTLGRIAAGLLPVADGRIGLGPVPLERMDADRLRAHIGFLPQQPVLFSDTLAANLRLADPSASDAALARVLEIAALSDFLADLPDGLATWIGEGGFNVSGGQARRLAVARLILGDFPMVVLDEPTTGLDAATAARLCSGLDVWLRDRTALILTHEPERVPPCERVMELAGGHLREIRAGSGPASGERR